MAHRDGCGGGVGHHHRHQEGGDAAVTLVEPDLDLLLERLDASDAGADPHAGSTGIGGQVACLLQGHVGCGYCELGAPVGSTDLLGVVEPGVGVEVVDAPVAHGGWAAEAVPEGIDTDPAGCDDPQAGDGDAPSLHQSPCFRACW